MKKLFLWVLLLGGLAYFGSRAYFHLRVAEVVNEIVASLRPFVEIDYEGVSSTLSGELYVEGITVKGTEFEDELRIDKLGIVTPSLRYLIKLNELTRRASAFKIPETFGFVIEGMRASTSADFMQEIYSYRDDEAFVPADADSAAALCSGKYGYALEALRDMGLRDIALDLRIEYRQGAADLQVAMIIDIENINRNKLDLTLADRFTLAAFANRNYRARLVAARLEVVDRSFNARSAELCRNAGLNDAEIMAAQLDAFKQTGLDRGIEFDEPTLQPYREFLAGKSTYIMTASPNEPVALSQIDLYKPSDVPNLLKLEAAAR